MSEGFTLSNNNIILNNKNPENHLVAHRGYSQCFPENTVLAVQAALDEGAKYIEIDIQLSADKQAVVFHDRDLQRLCHQQGTIYDYKLGELNKFSSYSPDRFKNKYLGERIASLTDIVTLFENYPDVTLFVELKRISIDKFGADVVFNAVEGCLEKIINQCVFISFSFDILELIRQQTSLPIGAVLDEWNMAITIEYKRLAALNPEYFFCDINSLPKEGMVNFLDSKIVTYECIETEKAISVLQRGVSFIETFDIKSMLQGIGKAWPKI